MIQTAWCHSWKSLKQRGKQPPTMGMLNMLATECSAPVAAKAETGNQAPRALPGRLDAEVASHTARQTIQLAITPLVNACTMPGRKLP